MINQKKQFIILIGSLLVFGFFITSFASYLVSRTALVSKIDSSELPLTSDNIYSEIEKDLLRPVFISSLMASNTFLKDWVLNGEKDEQKIRKYLQEIQEKFETVTSFFISENTHFYYHPSSVLKKVTADNNRDDWYFRVKNQQNLYEINVDMDMANKDDITIFVNHKVFDYKKNFIGATGIGLTVNSVKKLIDKYQKKYGRNIYFTDLDGKLILYDDDKSPSVKNINDIEGMSSISKQILKTDTQK